jgi:pimeloyl-ACP methyl ester carboxylesterase
MDKQSKPISIPNNFVRLALIFCLALLIISEVFASRVQNDFGRVSVSNVMFPNYNGIRIRAKLFQPNGISEENPGPGVVYIHGYQNNRETSDAYSIEMARRGFVVLSIDAIGRGNSGVPNDINDPNFDPTFGGRTSFEYLKSLPFVLEESVGLMGHSLGAEMAYTIAMEDPSVKALVISGFAYKDDATIDRPQNMLMIYGEHDEYRERMTGMVDVKAGWMTGSQTQSAIGEGDYEFDRIYGNFQEGTARKVLLLPVIHLNESHNREGIAAAVEWMRNSLKPSGEFWVESENQIWVYKEVATLVAMLAGLFSVIPLGLILLRSDYFQSIMTTVAGNFTSTKKQYLKYATINGLLMWLYLPLILVLFGLHVYVVRIDKVFPMMMVNGTVWWFVLINLFGFILFYKWFRSRQRRSNLKWSDLGISYSESEFGIDWKAIGKTVLLGAILFIYIYFLELILETIFIVDFRFIFPFASDMTVYRFKMWVLYFPFLLIGFIQLGFFLHGQLRLSEKDTWWKTYLYWTISNVLVMVIPIILFLLLQYIPIFAFGIIPFVGPGGMLASFTMNLFHIIGVLLIVLPIQTWFFQLTRRPYLGAVINAAIVTWMFVSSQVIAPIPV